MLHELRIGIAEENFLKIHILEATHFPFLQRTKYLASIVRAIRHWNISHVTAVAASASVSCGIGLNES